MDFFDHNPGATGTGPWNHQHFTSPLLTTIHKPPLPLVTLRRRPRFVFSVTQTGTGPVLTFHPFSPLPRNDSTFPATGGPGQSAVSPTSRFGFGASARPQLTPRVFRQQLNTAFSGTGPRCGPTFHRVGEPEPQTPPVSGNAKTHRPGITFTIQQAAPGGPNVSFPARLGRKNAPLP